SCPPATPSPHFDRMQQRVTVAPLTDEAGVAGLIVTVEDMTPALDHQRALASRIEADDAGDPPDALAGLDAQDWRVRGSVVRALRQTASPDDIRRLLQSLEHHHQNLNVLSSALQVLTSANQDVVPALVELLADPHPNL